MKKFKLSYQKFNSLVLNDVFFEEEKEAYNFIKSNLKIEDSFKLYEKDIYNNFTLILYM